MREAVLNSEGLSIQFASRDDALDALDSVATGLLLLSKRNHIARHLWMKEQPYAIAVCPETSLTDLFRHYLDRSKDKARFMLQLATRCPIDDGIEAADLGNFLDEEVDGLPQCTDLLWCAISGTKLSVSLSPNNEWHRNPLVASYSSRWCSCKDSRRRECFLISKRARHCGSTKCRGVSEYFT